MKTNFIIYLIKPGISICPEKNLNLPSFAMYLRKYHHLPLTTTTTTHKNAKKNPKIISVNLALDITKETLFFNTRCANPWKFCEVKRNCHKNMVQQEKIPSVFAGRTGVELKSERRIEKISMSYNGVLTPQTKTTSLKL